MPQIVGLTKTSPRVKRAKLKEEKRPEWNDAISDLSIHRPSPQELERKRLLCKSKNAEVAKISLLKKEKDLNKLQKKDETEKDKGSLKNGFYLSEEKNERTPRDIMQKCAPIRFLNGLVKLAENSPSVQKYAGRPVVTAAPKTPPSVKSESTYSVPSKLQTQPPWLSSPRVSRRQSPASSDSSPIRRIGRCASKLQSMCNDNMSNLNHQRLDHLVQILKNLSGALDSLENKVCPSGVDEDGDKRPKLDNISSVTAFNEQLLSEFCRLVNLFQKVTQELEKERFLREELSAEVGRQGTLIEELSVELLQIECQFPTSPGHKNHELGVAKGKSGGDAVGGPETCRVNKNEEGVGDKNSMVTLTTPSTTPPDTIRNEGSGSGSLRTGTISTSNDSRMAYITKGSVSLPDVRDGSSSRGKQPLNSLLSMTGSTKRRAVDGNILSPGTLAAAGGLEHQSRARRSNLAITVSTSRGQLLKGGEEMAAAIISTVCSTDCGEMFSVPPSASTSLTYVVEDDWPSTGSTSMTSPVISSANQNQQPAIMLTLPQQCDARTFAFDGMPPLHDRCRPHRHRNQCASSSSLSEETVTETPASDFILLEMDASWLPDVRTLRRTSPNDWKGSAITKTSMYKQWPEPLPQPPPPSREESPLVIGSRISMVTPVDLPTLSCGSDTSTQDRDDSSPLITDCRPPFSFEESTPSVAVDLFQEITSDSSEAASRTLEAGDCKSLSSTSREEDLGSMSDAETCCEQPQEPPASGAEEKAEGAADVGDDVKRRLDMEELLSKLEALQTHYMSAHIKLQSLVDRSSSCSNSPHTSDTEPVADVMGDLSGTNIEATCTIPDTGSVKSDGSATNELDT